MNIFDKKRATKDNRKDKTKKKNKESDKGYKEN